MDLAAAVAPTTSPASAPCPSPIRSPRCCPTAPWPGAGRCRAAAFAATSLAVALTARPRAAGAWLAVVDVPWLGVEAAAELGVPLERLRSTRVRPWSEQRRVADLVAAVLDGFELVVTRVPRRPGDAARCAVSRQGAGQGGRADRRRRPRPAVRRRHHGGVVPGVGGRRARVGSPARQAGHRVVDRPARPRRAGAADCWCAAPTAEAHGGRRRRTRDLVRRRGVTR